MSRFSRRTLFVALFAVWVFPAFAFVPGEGTADLEIRPPETGPRSFGRFVRGEEGLDADLDLFVRRVGGAWAVQRDPLLGTPHQLVGSGIEYGGGPIDDEDLA
ncbi:MAG: hypothetical protein ABIH26_01320, partial [Candidatus Eisenbacteria bacterium]